MARARFVLTDSGGIQEETTALGVPCLTLRDNTERPVTVTHGTNEIVGTDSHRIAACVGSILAGSGKRGGIPPLWDGRASERIVDIIEVWGQSRGRRVGNGSVRRRDQDLEHRPTRVACLWSSCGPMR